MEFPSLGKHCSVEDCKLLDFLPFTCDGCRQTFCLDHRKYKSHQCRSAPLDVTVPQCPMCSQIISISNNEDINRVVEEHISQGCPPIRSNPNRTHRCSQKGCKKGEFVPVICKGCHKNYCFNHRLVQDHTCISSKLTEKKTAAISHININSKGLTTVANQTIKTLPTVQHSDNILKIKTAKGNPKIPESKRMYLEVVYPTKSKIHPKLMFFNEEWSIGKVIDVIADAGGIINTNNKPGAEKLCLYSLKSGEVLPSSAPLNSLSTEISAFDSILLDTIVVH